MIRRATIDDVNQLKELFYNTITHVNSKDYNPEQINAWRATVHKTESLIKRINEQFFCVFMGNDNQIVGFSSVDDTGYLDLMYVHKDFQRMGIASALMKSMVYYVLSLGLTKMTSEVSITAKPLFEKFNFKVIEQQLDEVNGVKLVNFRMELNIDKEYYTSRK